MVESFVYQVTLFPYNVDSCSLIKNIHVVKSAWVAYESLIC